MSNNPNWPLLAKYLSGECDSDENLKIADWIEGSAENRQLLESMKNLWAIREKSYEASDVKSLWNEVANRITSLEEPEEQIIYTLPPKEKKKNLQSILFGVNRIPILRYAAVLFAVVAISIFYFLVSDQIKNGEEIQWTTVEVNNGEQYELSLNDDTKLILDAGSKLQIPENFGDVTREIKLEGEAYFEVTRNREKPFRVYSSNAVVEVLGTKFNVRSWDETGKVEVAVADGKVSLSSNKNTDEKIILTEGFFGSLSETGELNSSEDVDLSKYLSWMKGEMFFADVKVSEVIAQLERWYNVSFSLQDSTIMKDRLTVTINKKSLANAVEVLSALTNTGYVIKNNLVTLKPAETKR